MGLGFRNSHAIMNALGRMHWLAMAGGGLGVQMRVIQWDRLDVAFNNCGKLAGHV